MRRVASRAKPEAATGAKEQPSKPAKQVRSKSAATEVKNTEPRFAANGYRLPDQLPAGEILQDNTKGRWFLGRSIACGGFGEIYLATSYLGERKRTRKSSESELNDEQWNNVIKVDHNNGPLYAEIHFYMRVAKEDIIDQWMKDKNLKFLGIPRYVASGIHDKVSSRVTKPAKGQKSSSSSNIDSSKYRFLVMQRFGSDLQCVLQKNNNTLSLKTAYTIAIKVIDMLEYIHEHGYIHADIKASNLLLGLSSTGKKGKSASNAVCSEIYLVDYGLVERYISREGEHKAHEGDLRRANNGTIEFTSRDAHIGAMSRRSDLETLGYNVLHWLSGGRLPWMSNLKDKNYVEECKKYYMTHVIEMMNYCFQKNAPEVSSSIKSKTRSRSSSPCRSPSRDNAVNRNKLSSAVPEGIHDFIKHVSKLDFHKKPDYEAMKNILEKALHRAGKSFDGRFLFGDEIESQKAKLRSSLSSPEPRRRRKSQEESDSEDVSRSPPKKMKPDLKKEKVQSKNVKKAATGKSSHNLSPEKAGNKKTSSVSPPHSAAFDNPTPAMLELLQKMKEKKLLLADDNGVEAGTKSKLKPTDNQVKAIASGKTRALANSIKSLKLKISPKKLSPTKTKTRLKHEVEVISSTTSTKENKVATKALPRRRRI